MEEISKKITKTCNHSDLYWKNYTRIKMLSYKNIEEYYERVIQPQIYYRINEGIVYREFEASILLSVWNKKLYSPDQYKVTEIIQYFFDDFKDCYKWTWKFWTRTQPFLSILKEFVDLIGKNSKNNVNVRIDQ